MGLDLSCNEYCVADIVFRLSANPANKFGGWCYASKETLGGFLGISKQNIHKIISRLIKRGLVERNEATKHLKTTALWYEKAIIGRLKDNSNETLPDSNETLLQGSNERLHNNNNTNNDRDNTFESFFASYPGKRKDRKVAQRSWKKIDPNQHEAIFIALIAYKASEEWLAQGGKFIPYTSKWLNQERWKDELPAAPQKKAFFQGMEMRQFDGKWKVKEKGQWNEYGGLLKEIEWR